MKCNLWFINACNGVSLLNNQVSDNFYKQRVITPDLLDEIFSKSKVTKNANKPQVSANLHGPRAITPDPLDQTFSDQGNDFGNKLTKVHAN